MKFKKKLFDFIKKQVHKTGYQIKKTNNFIFLDSILNKLLSQKGNINFIQIGGNDGINDDPLHHFIVRNKKNVTGIILEPVKDYFKELEKNYKKYPLIETLNLAIHNTESEMIINRLSTEKESIAPKYAKGIASFKKDHHVNCKVPSEFIVEEKVNCISLEKLVIEKNNRQVDLLQIDTEGYDAEIILNIDFNKFKPSIINFEYYVPQTMSKEQYNKILTILNENDYELWKEVNDITAYQRNLFIKEV